MPSAYDLVPVTNFKPEGSSQILAVGYMPEIKVLTLEFTRKTAGRSIYFYANVTEADLRALVSADSIGSHFIHNIKRQEASFPYTKVSDAEIAREGFAHLPQGEFPAWWPLPVSSQAVSA